MSVIHGIVRFGKKMNPTDFEMGLIWFCLIIASIISFSVVCDELTKERE